MAPKLWKGVRGKSPILKRPAIVKTKGTAPSAIKGLAGFRKASFIFTGAVDKGVSQQNAPLASRAAVLTGLDARLVCIDASTNTDKYYVLQGLEDTKIPEGKPQRCYAYQRWGRTGTGGVCRLQGPMDQKTVEKHLFWVFKTKTGADWGSLKAGEKAKPGKYWLAIPSEADPHAIWQYYVDDGVDRKRNGWYPYEGDAMKQVEELYAEHIANKKGSNATAQRFVASGKFTYCLDLQRLFQRNTKTGKERKLRRSVSTKMAFAEPAGPGSSPAETCAGLARADTAETIPAPEHEVEMKTKAARLPLSRCSSTASTIPGLPHSTRKPPKANAASTPMEDMRDIAKRGEVEKLSQAKLKSWLSSMSIATSGRKPDLVDRVYTILED